jgi:hypothetical protein
MASKILVFIFMCLAGIGKFYGSNSCGHFDNSLSPTLALTFAQLPTIPQLAPGIPADIARRPRAEACAILGYRTAELDAELAKRGMPAFFKQYCPSNVA